MHQPNLETERLQLRRLTLKDAKNVQALASEFEIADTTANLPHPYLDGMAEEWISTHESLWDDRKASVFGIFDRKDGKLVGCIDLRFSFEHNKAEMGYWVGKPYWGNGYCTEAVKALLKFGFETMNLNKIYAHHMGRNPASGRVMAKAGMRLVGTMYENMVRRGRVEDLVIYEVLRRNFTGCP